MIFFFNASGALIRAYPENVYQGTLTKKVYFAAPFSEANTVNVAFVLPNGKRTTLDLLTPSYNTLPLLGVQSPTGDTFALWEYTLPALVTAFAGDVKAQFFVNQPNGNGDITTLTMAAVTITVVAGVAPTAPDPTTLEGVFAAFTNLVAEWSNFKSGIQASLAEFEQEVLANINVDFETKINSVMSEYQTHIDNAVQSLSDEIDGLKDNISEVITDSALSSTSLRPVQNKVITEAINDINQTLAYVRLYKQTFIIKDNALDFYIKFSFESSDRLFGTFDEVLDALGTSDVFATYTDNNGVVSIGYLRVDSSGDLPVAAFAGVNTSNGSSAYVDDITSNSWQLYDQQTITLIGD